jgi:hypothetical protein
MHEGVVPHNNLIADGAVVTDRQAADGGRRCI